MEDTIDFKKSLEYRRKAKENFVEGNFSKSIELYNKSLQTNPYNIEIYYAKAQVYLEIENNLDSVVLVYNKIFDLCFESIKAQKLKKDLTKDFIQLYNERGMLHYANRDYEKSIKDLKHLLELRTEGSLNSFDFQWLTLLGNAFFATNRIDSAIVYYNKGFELEKSDEVGVYIRQDYYDLYYEGNYDTYISVFSENIKKHPNSYVNYMYRGELKAMKNDFVGALYDFRMAVALQPTTHNWINKAAMEWKVGSRDQAKKDFSDAMALNINEAYKISDYKRANKSNYNYLIEYVIESTKQLIDENKE